MIEHVFDRARRRARDAIAENFYHSNAVRAISVPRQPKAESQWDSHKTPCD